MNSLNFMCCRVIEALLQLLKKFSSASKMAVLPGYALCFMVPDGTEDGWIWIQLIKTTDRNIVLSTLFMNRQQNALDDMLCGYLLFKYAVPNFCM